LAVTNIVIYLHILLTTATTANYEPSRNEACDNTHDMDLLVTGPVN